MASLRAHLFDAMVRVGVKLRLGSNPRLTTIRAVFGKPGFAPPPEARFTAGERGGVRGEWVDTSDLGPDAPRLLYLHGGGFVGCSPLTHRAVTGSFATAGFRVFAPVYRLAPEHPFPAAIEDATAAWAAFAKDGPAVVAGDSAGGNLALALMIECRRLGLPMPRAGALFSPGTDLTSREASRSANARRDAMFRPTLLERFPAYYLGGADPRDPRASPIEADLAGLPPLLLHVGERELMRDDVIAFADKAREAGVPVVLKVWLVVPHAWQLAESFVPEARDSLAQAAAFLRAAPAQTARVDAA